MEADDHGLILRKGERISMPTPAIAGGRARKSS